MWEDTVEVFHHQVKTLKLFPLLTSISSKYEWKFKIFPSNKIFCIISPGDNNDVRLLYDITTIKEMEGGGPDNIVRSCTPTSVATPTRGAGDQERKLASGMRSCMITDTRDLRTSLARYKYHSTNYTIVVVIMGIITVSCCHEIHAKINCQS